MAQRLLIIGLDGYEKRVAEHLMREGKMPNLAALIERAAHLDLAQGVYNRSELAWRHFATGMAPTKSGAWSALSFDPERYAARRFAGAPTPFLAPMGGRAVVLDAPHFDLKKADGVRGFVNWGAHDPDVEAYSRPNQLRDELHQRFGPYPAQEDIHGFVWTDPEQTRAAGDRLTKALDLRADITAWMLKDRMPDWDVAITVVSELHSATEPLWHGFAKSHPLHDLPSGAPARDGLFSVYQALDRMIGRLQHTFPDVAFMLCSMHGMGRNIADVPSMILLPEFLYRLHFGQERFVAPDHWVHAQGGTPMLTSKEHWEGAIFEILRKSRSLGERARGRLASALDRLSVPMPYAEDERVDISLEWIPSTFYTPFWKEMRAFALPSNSDGRIRLNVKGRESHGLIEPADYEAEIARLERELLQLTDARTGQAVVDEFIRTSPGDPMNVSDTDGDLIVIWRGDALGFKHPNMRPIGPAPYRRTGGRTHGPGDFYFIANDIEAGEYGTASVLDVAPTIEDIVGMKKRRTLSGESILPRLKTHIDA